MAVFGTLKDIRSCLDYRGRLRRGLDYLFSLSGPLKGKDVGFNQRVPVKGDEVFAIHQIYKTKPEESARFEIHRRYIDLQYLWSGEELIYVSALSPLYADGRYCAGKDIKFYRFQRGASKINMRPGILAVFYPHDAHAPGISVAKPVLAAKTVIKVLID